MSCVLWFVCLFLCSFVTLYSFLFVLLASLRISLLCPLRSALFPRHSLLYPIHSAFFLRHSLFYPPSALPFHLPSTPVTPFNPTLFCPPPPPYSGWNTPTSLMHHRTPFSSYFVDSHVTGPMLLTLSGRADMGRGKGLFGSHRHRSRRRDDSGPKVDLFGAAIGYPYVLGEGKKRSGKSSSRVHDYSSFSEDQYGDDEEGSYDDEGEEEEVSDYDYASREKTYNSRSRSRTPSKPKPKPKVKSSPSRRRPSEARSERTVTPGTYRRRSFSRHDASRRPSIVTTPLRSLSHATSFIQPPTTTTYHPLRVPSNMSAVCVSPTPLYEQPVYYQQPPLTFVPAAPAPTHEPRYVVNSVAQPLVVYPDAATASPQLTPQQAAAAAAAVAAVGRSSSARQPRVDSSSSRQPRFDPSSRQPRHDDSSSDRLQDSELERLQRHVDRKMSHLARKPSDAHLRADLRKLQDRVNKAINLAIAEESDSEEDDDEWGFASQHHNNNNRSGRDKPKPHMLPPRDSSVRGVPLRHICSDCGVERSDGFHDAHPLRDDQGRRRPNLCRACREEKARRGVASPWPFCFSCGVARSKDYQRRHPTLPGDPMVPNHCGSCSARSRVCEAFADSSSVGSVCIHPSLTRVVLF